MEGLPNDIIMRIIREADGGLHTHKRKFLSSIQAINEVAEVFDRGNFFDILLENETLSIASFMAGCRQAECFSEEEIREMASDMRAEGIH